MFGLHTKQLMNRQAIFLALFIFVAILLAIKWQLTLDTGLSFTEIEHALIYWAATQNIEPFNFEQLSLLYVSLPRVVAGLLSGMALGVSGVLLQTVTHNPLASPSLLGIGAGAHLALTVCYIFFPQLLLFSPLLVSFSGAIAVVLMLYLLSGQANTPLRLVLSGAAISMTAYALATALSLVHEQSVSGLFLWGAGNTMQLDWENVTYAWSKIVLAIFLILPLARSLDILVLGDELSQSLGVSIKKTTLITLAVASALVALSVILVGPLSFVGLVVGAMLRLLGVRRHSHLVVLAAIFGALLVTVADSISMLFGKYYGTELATGLVTAALGAPCLLLMVLHLPFRFSESFNNITIPLIKKISYWQLIVILCFGILSLVLCQLYYSDSGAMTWDYLLPRILVAMFAGALLAQSGVLLQSVTRNALAGPEILGVTQGAGLAAVIFQLGFPALTMYMPLAALIGGMSALGVIFLLVDYTRADAIRLALCGVALAAFLSASSHFLVASSGLRVGQVLTWLTGTLYHADWLRVFLLVSAGSVCLFATILRSWTLTYAQLSDDSAMALGYDSVVMRRQQAILAAVAASLAAATVGVLSFVGLMAPHIAGRLYRGTNRQYIILTTLIGSLLVLLADVLGRVLFYPIELPAGLLTAIVGGPFFLYLSRSVID